MNLGLSKLERAVRERMLADVQQSDAMWEVYRKRRWVRRLRQAVVVLSSAVAVPCLLGVGVIWPLFLTTLCIGLGAVGPPGSHQNPYPDPRYLEGNGIEVALLLQALFVTSWTLVWLASQTKALRQSRKLAMLAFLPLSDAEHRRQVLRASLWSHALAMAYFTLFGYAYWCVPRTSRSAAALRSRYSWCCKAAQARRCWRGSRDASPVSRCCYSLRSIRVSPLWKFDRFPGPALCRGLAVDRHGPDPRRLGQCRVLLRTCAGEPGRLALAGSGPGIGCPCLPSGKTSLCHPGISLSAARRSGRAAGGM